MAKFAGVTLCLFAMLVAGVAAEEFMGFSASRKLQQSYTCAQAERIKAPGACSTLFNCASKADSRVAKAQSLFLKSCDKCVAAIKSTSCSGSLAIPSDCKSGLGIKAVVDCLNAQATAGH